MLLAGAVIAFAAYRAPRLAWLADDSFISFRYAWNLVHGHGLVNNAGEYVLLTVFVAFVGYVAHSGGDFMFARRLLPAMPFLFLVLEDALVYPGQTEKIHGIANEPAYSTNAYIAMRKTQAHVAAKAFGRAPVRGMFEGGMCMFAYYSRLP